MIIVFHAFSSSVTYASNVVTCAAARCFKHFISLGALSVLLAVYATKKWTISVFYEQFLNLFSQIYEISRHNFSLSFQIDVGFFWRLPLLIATNRYFEVVCSVKKFQHLDVYQFRKPCIAISSFLN